jgi:outer membrane protein OmpA-like peptidoglycan-associated protein
MAERYPRDEEYWNEVIRTSRQAVQIAEDARAIAVERQIQEKLEKERAEAQRRQEEARQKAEEQARLRAEADAKRAEADVKRAEAEAKQLAAEKDRVKAEQEKFRAEQEKLKAELEAARAATLKVEADAARAKAQQAAEEANKAREQAEAERKALRERLLRQFSQALPTRDSERGLVVNMGDVLFDTAKFDLRPVAREKLARLAGICLAYPGLRLEAEGHTDNTGAEDFNQKLSEQRAAAVRDYLVSQGLPETSLSSKGLGMSSPVAPNNTSQGRQQNRRVELIVSGEVIGTAIGK